MWASSRCATAICYVRPSRYTKEFMDKEACFTLSHSPEQYRKALGYLGKRDFDTLEMGYVLNRAYWGRGYAAESCQALLTLAFSQGIHRVYAECDPENAASWRLLERLQFCREGHLRQNVFFWTDAQGKPLWKDTYVYARLCGDCGKE